jgi:N-methylhydantoinase A
MELPYHGSVPALLEDFLDEYARRYGETAVPDATGFELVTFVILGRGAMRRPKLTGGAARTSNAAPVGERPAYDPFAAEFLPTPIYTGEDLRAGDAVDGPAVIQYAATTLVVCSGQRAEVGELLAVEIRGRA